ncbi:hypothetical protein X948_4330 [Burkholderia pseudomallei MSHR5608]|nr:hypothetical protein X948_4330 [Burkholderia pseudomallei MSHR5608]
MRAAGCAFDAGMGRRTFGVRRQTSGRLHQRVCAVRRAAGVRRARDRKRRTGRHRRLPVRAARASRLKEALGRRRDPRPPGARGRELGKFRNEECVFCVKSFLRSFRTSPIMTSINVTLIDGLM